MPTRKRNFLCATQVIFHVKNIVANVRETAADILQDDYFRVELIQFTRFEPTKNPKKPQ